MLHKLLFNTLELEVTEYLIASAHACIYPFASYVWSHLMFERFTLFLCVKLSYEACTVCSLHENVADIL